MTLVVVSLILWVAVVPALFIVPACRRARQPERRIPQLADLDERVAIRRHRVCERRLHGRAEAAGSRVRRSTRASTS